MFSDAKILLQLYLPLPKTTLLPREVEVEVRADAALIKGLMRRTASRRPSLDLAVRARRPAHHKRRANAECKRPARMDSDHLHDIESVGPSRLKKF